METIQPTETEILSILDTKKSSIHQRTPASEEKRLAASRKAITERKDEIMAKVHAGDSNQKRSETLKKRYAANPEILQKQREIIKRANQVVTDAANQKRQQAFGKDIPARLYELHHIQGLTTQDIAHDSGYKEDTILSMLKEYNIEHTPPTHQNSIEQFQIIQKALWTKPEALQKLNPNQKTIIEKRFLSEDAIPSQQEVGAELGITRQGVDLSEKMAVKKLTSK